MDADEVVPKRQRVDNDNATAADPSFVDIVRRRYRPDDTARHTYACERILETITPRSIGCTNPGAEQIVRAFMQAAQLHPGATRFITAPVPGDEIEEKECSISNAVGANTLISLQSEQGGDAGAPLLTLAVKKEVFLGLLRDLFVLCDPRSAMQEEGMDLDQYVAACARVLARFTFRPSIL